MSATTELAGLVHGMSDETYHALPHLSSTGARLLLDSPAKFRYRQDHPIRGAALDVGTITHALVLGTPNNAVVIEGGRGKSEREQEARDNGLIPVLAADYALATAMAEAVLAHKGARQVIEPGVPEVSAFAVDPDTGVHLKARFDVLGPVAADVKTTAGSAGPRFTFDAAKYGYPIQQEHYLDTLELATGDRPPFAFVVVEKAPPHLVAVHHFDEITRLVARDLAAKARRIYAECLAADEWPGYGSEPLITQAPGWWLDQADDNADVELTL